MSLHPENGPNAAAAASTSPGGATRNGVDLEHESFDRFFESWLAELDRNLQALIAAASGDSCTSIRGQKKNHLRPLINRVVAHYEKRDVLAMFSPTWTSKLEDAFLGIGGWRPSTAFHLLYSRAGPQLQAQLEEVLRGINTGDLGDLSPNQLGRVDEMQRRTIREEWELTETMAKQQEMVSDLKMVELSHVATEMRLNEGRKVEEEEEEVDTAIEEKRKGLREILDRADDLRLRTLKGVIQILEPLQAVHFFITAAELHLRLHEWGKRRDDLRTDRN